MWNRNAWLDRVASIKRDIYALYLAYRDERTPWYARLLAACVVAYAVSPIDLIPDPIPVLGYLDDFILVPLGVVASVKMIPSEVMADARERASAEMNAAIPTSRTAAAVIVVVWLLLATAGIVLVWRFVGR